MSDSKAAKNTFPYEALRLVEHSCEERRLTKPHYGTLSLTDHSEPGPLTEETGLTEETIDLSAMFDEDVSSTGSFDLRRSRLNSFQKMLQAIPIPALLVDESCMVAFVNRACKRATGQYETIDGRGFSVLFPNRADGEQAEALIRRVFHDRMPLAVEGTLGIDEIRMLGRIHFRSVRIQKMRMMLVIIEDVTPSKSLSRKTSGPVN
jgi:PAS domain-containing protein